MAVLSEIFKIFVRFCAFNTIQFSGIKLIEQGFTRYLLRIKVYFDQLIFFIKSFMNPYSLPYRIIVLCIITLICACKSGSKNADAVARVYDDYLYKSDLIGIVPSGTSSKDSTEIVNRYIQNWVKQKLVIHSAEENLAASQKDFEKQLDDYRNSLIVYSYEKELIRQKMDTTVTDAEINTYYKLNQNDFLLKDNIVKVRYIKLPANSSNNNLIKNYYLSETEAGKEKLEDLCKKYAVNYYLDDTTWLYFTDLLKEIPIRTYNQEDYLRNHRSVEVEDSLYSYYVYFKGFQIKESVSPLSFESDNVRKIILNKRKLKLIKDMQEATYNEALQNNDIEIYKPHND